MVAAMKINTNGAVSRRGKSGTVTKAAIESTTNYNEFVYDPRNRPVDWKHVEELVDSIEQNNLLEDFPIVVEKGEQGKFIVLDGQHRLESARLLEVPIYYKVSTKMSFADVNRINTAQSGWENKDYLNRWVREGNIEYIRFKNFFDTYPHMGLNYLIELGMHASSQLARKSFRNGSYKFDNWRLAAEVANASLSFEPYIDWYGHRNFLIALRNLMSHPDYSHDKMLKKVEYQSSKLRKCYDSRSYIEMLVSIYNYKSRGENISVDDVSRKPK